MSAPISYASTPRSQSATPTRTPEPQSRPVTEPPGRSEMLVSTPERNLHAPPAVVRRPRRRAVRRTAFEQHGSGRVALTTASDQKRTEVPQGHRPPADRLADASQVGEPLGDHRKQDTHLHLRQTTADA
jgi:hypothetical protein